jgi:hypothetical protein
VPLVDSSDLYGLAALSPDVEEEAALRALVGQCLYELHPLERQALVLHHVQQLTVEEVAVITHRSVDGVRGLLKRGRVRFRVVYERHNDGTLAGVPMLGTLVKHARLARQRAALWVRQRCPDSQIVADLARATIELGAVAALGVASLLSPSTSAVTRASADGTKSSASHPAFIPVAFIHPSPVESDGPGGAKNGRTGRSDPNRPVSTDTRVRVALPTAGAADVAVNPDDGRLVLEVVTSPLGHEIRYLDKTELGCRSAPSVPSPREVSAEAAGSRTSAYCEDD